jgi:hypothetical protein
MMNLLMAAAAVAASLSQAPQPLISSSKDAILKPELTKVDWNRVMRDSSMFLAVQHGFRLGQQPFTRRELKGKFWPDYVESVQGLRRWRDGDSGFINYFGHPMQGGVTNFIVTQNDPRGRKLEFDPKNPEYWRSRLRATGFTAVYSTQFELGPVSEASIGNVGGRNFPNSLGYVDLVITPASGMVFQVAEDIVDKYFIKWVESKTTIRPIVILTRGFFNPTRTFANAMRFRWPWHRETRPSPTDLLRARRDAQRMYDPGF